MADLVDRQCFFLLQRAGCIKCLFLEEATDLVATVQEIFVGMSALLSRRKDRPGFRGIERIHDFAGTGAQGKNLGGILEAGQHQIAVAEKLPPLLLAQHHAPSVLAGCRSRSADPARQTTPVRRAAPPGS